MWPPSYSDLDLNLIDFLDSNNIEALTNRRPSITKATLIATIKEVFSIMDEAIWPGPVAVSGGSWRRCWQLTAILWIEQKIGICKFVFQFFNLNNELFYVYLFKKFNKCGYVSPTLSIYIKPLRMALLTSTSPYIRHHNKLIFL